MAVQKSKKSRSRRDMRRSHDKVWTPTLSADSASGEIHYRHHLTAGGYYRGKQFVKVIANDDESNSESQE